MRAEQGACLGGLGRWIGVDRAWASAGECADECVDECVHHGEMERRVDGGGMSGGVA